MQSQYLKALAANLRVGLCNEWKRGLKRFAAQNMFDRHKQHEKNTDHVTDKLCHGVTKNAKKKQ